MVERGHLSSFQWTRLTAEILWVIFLLIPHGLLLLLRAMGFFLPKQKKMVKKVVLVTGAGQGLGRELAFEFGRLGATVVCVDQNASTAEATRRRLRAELASARAFACDVSDRAQVRSLAQRVRAELGAVDVLVNNAAVLNLAEADGADGAQQIERMARVNLLSHVWMIQAFLPDMLERGEGHVVAISSASALFGLGDAVTYSACKAGVAALMDAFSDQLRKAGMKNIHTTTVFPYFLRTPLIEEIATLRFPPMEVRPVAEQIVKGIREHERSFTIPRSLGLYTAISRLLPQHLADKLRAIFYVRLDAKYNELGNIR
ncbi:Dehydrogenase/reductase SDR family protein 7-like [Gryllus bimaculatus]|nr:Dehydrogenase/reductase SDR family protein 7-like [Gryllus bimaculatus]